MISFVKPKPAVLNQFYDCGSSLVIYSSVTNPYYRAVSTFPFPTDQNALVAPNGVAAILYPVNSSVTTLK